MKAWAVCASVFLLPPPCLIKMTECFVLWFLSSRVQDLSDAGRTITEWWFSDAERRPHTNRYHFPRTFERARCSTILKRKTKDRFFWSYFNPLAVLAVQPAIYMFTNWTLAVKAFYHILRGLKLKAYVVGLWSLKLSLECKAYDIFHKNDLQ